MNGSCMGGWCTLRNQCALHHARVSPVYERLCTRGYEFPVPIVLYKQQEKELGKS